MKTMMSKVTLANRRVWSRLVLVGALSLPIVSCAAKPRHKRKKAREKKEVVVSSSHLSHMDNQGGLLDELLDKLISHGERLLGKPYRARGIAPWPLDCSGYVSYLYKLLGVSIPHSSAALSTLTKKVVDPRPGDLVFFKGRNAASSRVGHVALVVANDNGELTIMHSTNSRGIIKHKLSNDAYFRKRYLFAGRLPWVSQMLEKGGDDSASEEQEKSQTANRVQESNDTPVLNWQKPSPITWLNLSSSTSTKL